MAGRPLLFKTKEELQNKIDLYFEEVPKEEWTITGLAIALDTSRETLCNYEAREEYFDTIKKAKDMVEHSYEVDLKKSGRTGTIFALKNFDWKDKQETDMNLKGELNVNSMKELSNEELERIATSG
jgi:hypothetical protein